MKMVGEYEGGSTRLAVPAVLRSATLSLALIATAALAILAVEVQTRLQVTLDDLLNLRAAASAAGESSLEHRASVSLERISAALQLARQVANLISVGALAGAIGQLIFGGASRAIRVACLGMVVLLLVRAYFWDIA